MKAAHTFIAKPIQHRTIMNTDDDVTTKAIDDAVSAN
jgi:hypothetical protein